MRPFTRRAFGATLPRMMSEYEAKLVALRDDLRREIERGAGVLATPLDARGEDTTPSQHPADVASDLTAREAVLTIESEFARELAQVEDALARIRYGTYGLCVECGRTIPRDRLAAQPQAARCLDCQRSVERRAV